MLWNLNCRTSTQNQGKRLYISKLQEADNWEDLEKVSKDLHDFVRKLWKLSDQPSKNLPLISQQFQSKDWQTNIKR